MPDIAEFVEQHQDIVKPLLEQVDRSYETLVCRVCEIAEIGSPTFQEDARTKYMVEALKQVGLKDVHSLPNGSVLGFTRSKAESDTLLLAAHIDTVFPLETDLKTRIEGSTLYGPGTGDNASNVAAILTLAAIMKDMGVNSLRNIAFCGTVREEGPGNLGGMAEVLDAHGETVGTVLAIDGHASSVMHRSLAIKRHTLRAEGPGGHAWSDFGTLSAIHEMARIVNAITSLKVPEEPTTTFNVGTIQGGTSVNAIAQECTVEVELRSLVQNEVERLEREVMRIIREVPQDGVRVTADLIGTRPAGSQPVESELVKLVEGTARYVGIEPELKAASTDAALSLSRGIPSVAFGTYEGEGTHTLQEQVDLDSLIPGLKHLALAVLMLAGIE
jgi:acetylornithine deacetylase/succinyl-diaminopimelate desuccinylase-like protein